MVRMMAIFAHPDDEGGIGGTLARYARQGVEISLVCATRGEAGEISDPELATPQTLAAVREEELQAACQILGIQELYFLDYCDSGMEGTAENRRPDSFIHANVHEVLGKMVRLIRQRKPHIVITFEPFGWYGHPDHQAVSRWATEAFYLAADAAAYADMGTAWQPQRLFHGVLPLSHFQKMLEEAQDIGGFGLEHSIEQIPREQLLKTEAAVTHVIDVAPYLDVKFEATLVHRTQYADDHLFRTLPQELLDMAMGEEDFIQIYPPPSPSLTEEPSDDLLAGI